MICSRYAGEGLGVDGTHGCCNMQCGPVLRLVCVQDGPLVARMVPWLYRLADEEHNRYEAPHELRVALLAGLRAAVPVVTDPQVGARVMAAVEKDPRGSL